MSDAKPKVTLQFRDARAEDREPIAQMTRDIWGGDDYLGDVWLDWVAATDSFLTVGLLDDRIVATGRLVALSAGEWWLEGMRVDPAFQGQGFSSQLHDHLVALARRQTGTLGLATNAKNKAIAHLSQRSGMQQQGLYRFLKFTGEGIASDDVQPLPLNDAITARIDASAWAQTTQGHVMDAWVTRRLGAAWFNEVAARGCRAWQCGSAFAVAGPERRSLRWWLYLLDGGTAAQQQRLALHLASLAHRASDGDPLRCFAPWHDDQFTAPLVAAGFGDPWDGNGGPFALRHFEMAL